VAVHRGPARGARGRRGAHPAFREALAAGDASLRQRFEDDEPIEALVRDRARMVDTVLRAAWTLHAGVAEKDVALVAVGGYGRGELHPCSDIDVLILLPKSEVAGGYAGIERFLTFLWDIGLEIGHSVRTIDDCQRESAADVSVATTLIEARLLSGPRVPRAGHAARAVPGPRVVFAVVLRGQGRGAAGAPPASP